MLIYVFGSKFVERRRRELNDWLQALLVPAQSASIAARAPPRRMWGGHKGLPGAAPLAHPYALRFLGLVPGASHRQPAIDPPYQEPSQVNIKSIEVVRGIHEDNYVDYEVLISHMSISDSRAAAIAAPRRSVAEDWTSSSVPASPSSGDGISPKLLYTYCRFSKFERLCALLYQCFVLFAIYSLILLLLTQVQATS